MAEQLRVIEAQGRNLLEQTVGAVQRERVLGAAKIDAGDVGRDTWAYAGAAVLRRRLAARLTGDDTRRPGLRFEAKAVGHVPALGLGDLDEHVLAGIVALGILHGDIDFSGTTPGCRDCAASAAAPPDPAGRRLPPSTGSARPRAAYGRCPTAARDRRTPAGLP